MRTGFLSIVACLALTAAAGAQSTSFTYQGRLKNGSQLASGLHDFRFRLFDAVSGGSQVGPTLCADNIAITEGLFTVGLDFGSVFSGQQRFLEMDLRADTGLDCSNSAGFTLLGPRQSLTSAPYSVFAFNAGNATTATSATSAATATNATQLNGQAASFYSNAGNLTGTLPSGALGGTYSGTLTLSNASNSFTGSGAGLTGLSASNIATGTLAGARLPNPISLAGSDATSILSGQNTSTGASAAGVLGRSTAASGSTFGVFGRADSPDGNGVQGTHSATSGLGAGVQGVTSSSSDGSISAGATGVLGVANSGFGFNAAGVRGIASGNGPGAAGVIGIGPNGVYGSSSSGNGVVGESSSTVTFAAGGAFSSSSTSGRGVYASGKLYGVFADTAFTTGGTAVYGESLATTGTGHGVHGKCASSAGDGVTGENSNGGTGVHGQATTGVGVYGETTSTSGGNGVRAMCAGNNGSGVFAEATATSGINYGVFGSSSSTSGVGVYGNSAPGSGTAYGVYGRTNSFNSTGFAVFAEGRLSASGTKSFRIDHPADLENKYLLHYCSEAPQPQNFYNGTVTLDESGQATVTLPDYFAAINKDPRYTLTAIGAPMPMLHIAAEIDAASLTTGARVEPGEAIPGCSFRIAGGAPGTRVSWRIDAIRNDRWVQQHGAPVEVEKQGVEKGTYQHPDLYGRPPERGAYFRAGAADSGR